MRDTFFSFLPMMGVFASLLFFANVHLLILCIRQRHRLLTVLTAGLLIAVYTLLQCLLSYLGSREGRGPLPPLIGWFVSLPQWLIAGIFFGIGVLIFLMGRHLRKERREMITPMSVKEAMDNLPGGMCFYVPGGRVVLVNAAMERFCRDVTGGWPVSGEVLRETLFSGDLKPGCSRTFLENELLITLRDGTTRVVSERGGIFQNEPVRILLASDVTELYQKTQDLRRLKRELDELNRRLTAYNREIVAMTAEKELLDARMRLHDEMGADLLTMRRYIENGGTAADRADIEARLRRNVKFLLTGQTQKVRDEYELMLMTAEKLGVSVVVTGKLPDRDPQKHVTATAIHECFTNTIRHAGGDELYVTAEETDESIRITFTNNGRRPAEPVREQGGLAALRALAESLPGGRMEISVSPRFAVILTMPKEVPYAL